MNRAELALTEELVEWLPRSPLFRSCTIPEIRLIASIAETRDLAAGEYLTHAGDFADAVFLVVSGELVITTPAGAETRVVVPPEDYGLVSVIEPRRYAQHTIARTPCRIIRIPADGLRALLDADVVLGHRLWRNIARLQTYHFTQLVDRIAGIEPRTVNNPYTGS